MLITQGKATHLVDELAGLQQAAASPQRGSVIAILVLAMPAHHHGDNEAQAIAALFRTLRHVAPEGEMQPFVDAGAPIATTPREVRAGQPRLVVVPADEALDVGRWLAALEGATGARASTRPVPAQPEPDALQAPLEPLRARELEVLQLLAAGRSNQEIAEELIVSVGTVRWHLKNIYGKLDVHSRTQAIARARALGLIG